MDFDLLKSQSRNKPSYTGIIPEFHCDCLVCQKQARSKYVYKLTEKNEKKINYSEISERKRFTWILMELGKLSMGQDIYIPTPDIVVFNKSRPHYLIQYYKDLLKYVPSGDKLGLTEILKSYTKIVRNRKKEEKPGIKSSEINNKDIGLLRYTAQSKENDNLDETPEIEDGPVRVLSEKEFFDFMYERVGSSIWKNVVYIQTVLKCKSGMPDIITVVYNTPQTKDLEDLKGSFAANHDEILMTQHPHRYCELLCKRIDALLHFNSSLEILNIKAEFSKDDLGKIWFTYATEIYVRKVIMPKKLSNEQGKLTQDELNSLNSELDERIPMCVGKPKYEEYSTIMKNIYTKAKNKADVERVLQAKPISYADVDLIARLQTKHTWTQKNSVIANTANPLADFDPRNANRAKERFDLMKSYSRNHDFFPTSYIQRREWIFTPSKSPDLKSRNKSSFTIKNKN